VSAAGRQMAAEMVDKLPPPDKLSSYKGGKEDGDGPDMEDDADMGAESHASALLDAIEAKDPGGIVKAFKDLSSACSE
jgi:hypothetical protein